MSRRAFLVAALFAAVAPPLRAQGARRWRIGWLSPDRSSGSPFFEALRGGLRDLGYAEGRNLDIDARWGEGEIHDLIRSRPDLIVTQGPTALALHRAGPPMPVVFGYSGDPVEAGFAASFARPGRNFTGMSFLSLELVGKRMEMLKEFSPGLKRVAILANPQHPGERGEFHASTAAATKLGLVAEYFPLTDAAQVDVVLAGVGKARCEAMDVFPDSITMRVRERIAEFAAAQRIPAISGWARFADSGNLLSYGPNLVDVYRELAGYVDRILRGASPASLPIRLPATLELVVNLKAARAAGLTVPRTLLLRADRVLE